jgi:predicted nuclease of predicted toxin-antitoxin system
VIVWIDAQLPPALASWLRLEFGIDASAVRDIGLRDATDEQIHSAARLAKAVVVTKDSDFLTLVDRLGSPTQIVWITLGNCSNETLKSIFKEKWPLTTSLLAKGEPLVEIGATG